MCQCVRACLCSCVRACVWVFTYIHTYSYKDIITGNAGCWQTWTKTMWRRTSKPSRLSLSREHISRECGMCSPRCVAGRADHRGYPSPRVSSTTECVLLKKNVFFMEIQISIPKSFFKTALVSCGRQQRRCSLFCWLSIDYFLSSE